MIEQSTKLMVAAAAALAVQVGAIGCSNSDTKGSGGKDASTEKQLADSGSAKPDGGAPDAAAARPKGPPPEVVTGKKDWPLANRDYAATRATFDSTITSTNVGRLGEVWRFPIPGASVYGAAVAAPIVIEGVVYYQDSANNVFALDLVTGATNWQKMYNGPTPGPNGVAVGWGKVMTAKNSHTFVAIDKLTGEDVWTVPLPIPTSGGIDIQSLAYDGLVYLSSVPVNASSAYSGGAAGTIFALDERTGDIVWQFNTIDSADIWGNETLNSGGGAWYPPSIDTETGVSYWGTGNAAPYPGAPGFPAGSSRPGPNLYTSSVVALSVRSGDLLWYHQEAPHNLFDLDFQCPPILVTAQVDGSSDPRIAIASGKTGTVIALERSTAKLLWRTVVGKHQNDDATTVPDEGLEVFPGTIGGVETPSAYADGVVYVPVVDRGTKYLPATHVNDAVGTGELLALDVRDGHVIWQQLLPDLAVGAATVVNDLVLTTSLDGSLFAFDRATGQKLFTYKAPDGINAPLAVVGDTVLVPAGTGLGTPYLVALRPLASDAGPGAGVPGDAATGH